MPFLAKPHKQLHNPEAGPWPHSSSTTSPITSTCTTHLQPLALATTLPPMTTQAAAQARGLLLNYHLLGSMGHHKHLLQPKPPPALALSHAPTTSQAPAQATGLLLPYHICTEIPQHKHLHKPPLLSFPLTSSANSHLKSTFASQGPASALPPHHSALTSQAPAQIRALLLPHFLLRHL